MRVCKLVMFLIRRRLGLKKYEGFQFSTQKSKQDWYFFGAYGVLWKMDHSSGSEKMVESSASLNWLLSDECKKSIRKNGMWWPHFIDDEE